MTDNANTLWVTGYSARGYKVSLTLAVDADNLTADIARLLAAVEAAGVLPREQGVEAGEEVEEIGYVAKQLKEDGTPKIAMYSKADQLTRKYLHYWLDNESMVTAFENATGVKVADIPVTPGSQFFDKDASGAMSFIVPVKTPCSVIWKLNDKYEGPGDMKHPKRLFLRWHGVAPAAQTAPSQTGWSGEGPRFPEPSDMPAYDPEEKTFTAKAIADTFERQMLKEYGPALRDADIKPAIGVKEYYNEHRGGLALARWQIRMWLHKAEKEGRLSA